MSSVWMRRRLCDEPGREVHSIGARFLQVCSWSSRAPYAVLIEPPAAIVMYVRSAASRAIFLSCDWQMGRRRPPVTMPRFSASQRQAHVGKAPNAQGLFLPFQK